MLFTSNLMANIAYLVLCKSIPQLHNIPLFKVQPISHHDAPIRTGRQKETEQRCLQLCPQEGSETKMQHLTIRK
jgi:hypothetical protein